MTDSHVKADTALNTIWRNDEDGRAVLLFITDAGLEAIGVEPAGEADASAPSASETEAPDPQEVTEPADADEAPAEPAPKRRDRPRKAAPAAPDTAAPLKSRDNTKQAQMIAMLRRKEGRDHRPDRRGHWLAAAHRTRRLRRGAQEEARADGDLREDRGPARLPATACLTRQQPVRLELPSYGTAVLGRRAPRPERFEQPAQNVGPHQRYPIGHAGAGLLAYPRCPPDRRNTDRRFAVYLLRPAVPQRSRAVSFDPQKWFISALLFFGVLVPGAVAVAILAELARRWGATLPVGWPPASTFDWMAFLVAGFIVGYLAHPPSHILNVLYNRTYRARRRRNGDPRLEEVRRIAGREVGPNDSYYDWAKARLKSEAPTELARVETIEGVSKGFRTLALIAAVGLAVAATTGEGLVALICLVLFGLAFLVFCERRLAATSEAYNSVIALERNAGKG